MRVAHIGNMAGDSFHIVKTLRAMGVDADLIVPSQDFGMSSPFWELNDLRGYDPYNFDFKRALDEFGLPEWVKVWWIHNSIISPLSASRLFQLARGYDMIHLHPFTPILLQFALRPYAIFEAGWIRTLTSTKADSAQGKLGRRAYHKANLVTFTNPDTYPMIMSTHPRKVEFVPFAIPTEKYRSVENIHDRRELLFFHPSRHVWPVKGNDILLRGFKKFVKSGRTAKLRMVNWGSDVEASKKLVRTLALERFVEWVEPMSKDALIMAYDECDATFDQFIIGVSGTTSFEALSCRRPAVIYMNGWNERFFKEMPPVINARTEEEIFDAMVSLQDSNVRLYYGSLGRRFVEKHMKPELVAKRMLGLYKEVLD